MYENKGAPEPLPQYEREPKEVEFPYDQELFEGWLEQNPFMDVNSPDYDKTLSNEVTKYSDIIEGRYKRSGKGHLVGTAQFYDTLNDYIKENIEGDIEESMPSPRPLMKSPSHEVFTPQNSSSPVSRGTSQPHKITLTAEEKAFAEGLSVSHPNGQQYTKEELWRAYASHKIKEKNK